MGWKDAVEALVSLPGNQGAAKDAFDFGRGNAAFTAGSREATNLPEGNPAADGPGVYA